MPSGRSLKHVNFIQYSMVKFIGEQASSVIVFLQLIIIIDLLRCIRVTARSQSMRPCCDSSVIKTLRTRKFVRSRSRIFDWLMARIKRNITVYFISPILCSSLLTNAHCSSLSDILIYTRKRYWYWIIQATDLIMRTTLEID